MPAEIFKLGRLHRRFKPAPRTHQGKDLCLYPCSPLSCRESLLYSGMHPFMASPMLALRPADSLDRQTPTACRTAHSAADLFAEGSRTPRISSSICLITSGRHDAAVSYTGPDSRNGPFPG